jgi:hypothetical protein
LPKKTAWVPMFAPTSTNTPPRGHARSGARGGNARRRSGCAVWRVRCGHRSGKPRDRWSSSGSTVARTG